MVYLSRKRGPGGTDEVEWTGKHLALALEITKWGRYPLSPVLFLLQCRVTAREPPFEARAGGGRALPPHEGEVVVTVGAGINPGHQPQATGTGGCAGRSDRHIAGGTAAGTACGPA